MKILGWLLAILGLIFFFLRFLVDGFLSTISWLWWILGPLLLIAGIAFLIYHYVVRRRNEVGVDTRYNNL